MNTEILSYLAGVIDSDGFLTIKRNTYSVRIKKDSKRPYYCERIGLKQTSPLVVDIIHQNFGGSRTVQKPNTKNGKVLYSIDIRNNKANAFIRAIFPYLIIKKRQAEILIELRKHISGGRLGRAVNSNRQVVSDEQISEREKMVNEIKSLNDTRNSDFHQPKPWK